MGSIRKLIWLAALALAPQLMALALLQPFIPNEGQVKNDQIAFYTHTLGGALYVTHQGELLHRIRLANGKSVLVKERLSTGALSPQGGAQTRLRVHYPEHQKPLKSYNILHLGTIAPHLKAELIAHEEGVEKLFILEPGGDISNLHITLQGVQELAIDPSGELRFSGAAGQASFTAPIAWQNIDGEKEPVKVAYRLSESGYGFELGEYNRDHAVVIDPLLAATYIGGSGSDEILDMAIDPASKRVYITGHSDSANLDDLNTSATGMDHTLSTQPDAFVARLDENLTGVEAISFFGGNGVEYGRSIAITPASEVVIAGESNSTDLYTANRLGDGPRGLTDGFVAKFSADLSSVAFRYVGGSSHDLIAAVAATASDIYVAGYTLSTFDDQDDLNTTAAHTPTNYDGFIARFDNTLMPVANNAVFFGGSQSDGFRALYADSAQVSAAGYTRSNDHMADYNNTQPSDQALYIARFNPDLTPIASAAIGGSDDDEALTLTSDGTAIYLGGESRSNDLPGTTAYGALAGDKSGFVLTLPAALNAVTQRRYIGGSDSDSIHRLTLDENNATLYIAGATQSTDFTTPTDALMTTRTGSSAAMIARLPLDLSDLNTSTYFGGDNSDRITALGVLDGDLFAAGITTSSDLPLSNVNAAARSSASAKEGFIIRLDENLTRDSSEAALSPTTHDFGNVVLGEYSSEAIFTLHNNGTDVLNIATIELNTTQGFSLDLSGGANPCNMAATTIDAYSYCTVSVQFMPTDAGTQSATLITQSDDTTNPEINATLTATGATHPVEKLGVYFDNNASLSSYDFGNTPINTTDEVLVHLINWGNTNLNIYDLNISDEPHYEVDLDSTLADACLATSFTLAPLDHCTILVRFAPLLTQSYTDQLRVESNDATAIQYFDLSGTGIAGLDASPAALIFGTIAAGGSSDKNITLTNHGLSDVNITASDLNNTDFSLPGLTTCDLAPGGDCNITVRFAPAAAGNYAATLTLDNNDPTYAPEYNLSITGSATASPSPAIDISANPDPLNFNVVLIGGELLSDPIVIESTGTSNLDITGFSLSDTTHFTLITDHGDTNDCNAAATLAQSESCSVRVRFNPQSADLKEANLSIISNDPTTPEANLSLMGTGSSSGIYISDISLNPSGGAVPLVVDFNVTAAGGSGSYTYEWDYENNGTVSTTGANSQHTYTQAGSFEPRLIVTDTANPDQNTTLSVAVHTYSLTGGDLAVDSYNIASVPDSSPLHLSFDVTASGGTAPYSYGWDFTNNGTIDSTLKAPEHIYGMPGDYVARVVITDDAGLTSSLLIPLTLNDSLSATLQATPLEGEAPLEVTYSGIISGGSAPWQLSWSFGDGSSLTESTNSTSFSTRHSFTAAGVYQSTLTITSDSGGMVQVPVEITALQSAEAAEGPVHPVGTERSSGEDEGYCFIATAAYGSYMASEVKVLRTFRDEWLLSGRIPGGVWFVDTYYRLSPPIADTIAANETLRSLVRTLLMPLVLGVKHPLAAAGVLLLLLMPLFIRLQRRLLKSPKLRLFLLN